MLSLISHTLCQQASQAPSINCLHLQQGSKVVTAPDETAIKY